MKPNLSKFSIVDFAIINSHFAFSPIENEAELQNIISSYEIDIDFAFAKGNDGIYKVLVKASINKDVANLKPGYSIFAEALCLFKVVDKDWADKINPQQLQTNAVMIALNTLRGFVASLSSGAPYGRYILPAFDLADLFAQKNKIIEDLKRKEEEVTKKSVAKKPKK